MHGHLASVCRPRGCVVHRLGAQEDPTVEPEKSPNRGPLQRLTVKRTDMINHYRFHAWTPASARSINW